MTQAGGRRRRPAAEGVISPPSAGPRLAVDIRALQDENYATRGIGEHTMYVLSLLRQVPGVLLLPIGDNMLPAPRPDAAGLFDAPMQFLAGLAGDVYFNPSPLTHDSSQFVAARRLGLRTAALVHDFIPFRQAAFRADAEAFAFYRYLVASLMKYDVLIANSDYTAAEIRAVLPGYSGLVVTVHCRSRFAVEGKAGGFAPSTPTGVPPASSALRGTSVLVPRSASDAGGTPVGGPGGETPWPSLGEPFVFVASADDPRKNVDIALRAACALRNLGLRLVIGGGFSAASQRDLMAKYPEAFYIAEPVFLPRLDDAELRLVYQAARFVLVGSRDEGFSLPVAEAIGLGRPVIASDIAAHAEQIADPALRFAPDDVAQLLAAAREVLRRDAAAGGLAGAYRHFDHDAEALDLRDCVMRLCAMGGAAPDAPQGLVMVGPGFAKATGIAVYNRMMMQECQAQRRAVTYVDADAMGEDAFFFWLFSQQDSDIVYVMGNNDLHHRRCFMALQNVPGTCILHDSRLFEFLLNLHGPEYLVGIWNRRQMVSPIDAGTVAEWQAERRKLPYSFLDPLLGRVRHLLVHSSLLAEHVAWAYDFDKVTVLPFALQMTQDEIRLVGRMRHGRRRAEGDTIHIVMLGETEATKGCCEIIFAVKMLRLIGLDAMLSFVGKSDEPYRTELEENARRLGIESHVIFMSYMPRAAYLDYMGSADVVVQLRYALFGQVSGPLGDAVACGVPVVTTEDLAVGTGMAEHCEIIPNHFSPLHIADAVRKVMAREPGGQAGGRIHSMGDYVSGLFAALGRAA